MDTVMRQSEKVAANTWLFERLSSIGGNSQDGSWGGIWWSEQHKEEWMGYVAPKVIYQERRMLPFNLVPDL